MVSPLGLAVLTWKGYQGLASLYSCIFVRSRRFKRGIHAASHDSQGFSVQTSLCRVTTALTVTGADLLLQLQMRVTHNIYELMIWAVFLLTSDLSTHTACNLFPGGMSGQHDTRILSSEVQVLSSNSPTSIVIFAEQASLILR